MKTSSGDVPHGPFALENHASAVFHSLPTMPPSRRAGLWDLYLVNLNDGCDPDGLPIPKNLLNGPSPFDGILVVVLSLSIRLMAGADANIAGTDREHWLCAAAEAVAPMNYRWYATGQSGRSGGGQAPRAYARCLIHFVVRAAFEDRLADASPLTCRILLSREGAARTFWETDGKSPALGSGSAFELDVPPGARGRITIRNLKSRIDEFHALDPLRLSLRIALVREIKKGARAFTEVENAIGETWEADTAAQDAEFPAEKRGIEEAVAYYLGTEAEDLSERIERLENLRGQIDSFPGVHGLKRGWRATRYTVDIDSALSTCNDLPQNAYGARLDMLSEVQVRCRAFVAMVRGRRRLFNRNLYALLPAVELLMQRVRETRGELAVLRGISVLRPLVEAKHVELGMLRATGALARRCLAAEAGLLAEENSLCLRVGIADEADIAATLRDEIQDRFPSMLGIEKVPGDISGEDLCALAGHVIPVDTMVLPISPLAAGE